MQEQLGLFEGFPDRLVRVTPARLGTWESCPRRYRMTYVDRPGTSRGRAWAHSTLGAVVHNVLRALFELPARDRTPHRAAALLHRYWKDDGFAGQEQAAEYRSRARRWLLDYIEKAGAEATPVGVERWVSATTGGIIAEGRVDRIDRRAEELVVVDYKTGRHAPSATTARDSRALALYAMAVGRTLRGECREVQLHHLPSGRVASWRHTGESLERHREDAERLATESSAATDAVAGGAEPDRHFPPRPGRQCATCEFRQHCPEGRAAASEIEPWALLGE